MNASHGLYHQAIFSPLIVLILGTISSSSFFFYYLVGLDLWDKAGAQSFSLRPKVLGADAQNSPSSFNP